MSSQDRKVNSQGTKNRCVAIQNVFAVASTNVPDNGNVGGKCSLVLVHFFLPMTGNQ